MNAPIIGQQDIQNTFTGTTVVTIHPDLPVPLLQIATVDGSNSESVMINPNVVRLLRGGPAGGPTIHLLHGSGLASFGGGTRDGILRVQGNDNKIKLLFEAKSGRLMLWTEKTKKPEDAAVLLQAAGEYAMIRVGGNGSQGSVTLVGTEGTQRIFLGSSGECQIGGNGRAGQITLFAADDETPNFAVNSRIHLNAGDASIRVGGHGLDGELIVRKANNARAIHIDGKSGDIRFKNADCAEEFDVDDPSIEPGSVLVFGEELGRLRMSDVPYDTRVAGILSGAGDYRPAIVLDRKPEREGRRPVALVGKAWCKVEAESAPIGVGSLLTTSSMPGHAMAATDRERAFGAVLGKALAPLSTGVGFVPVLVSLQ